MQPVLVISLVLLWLIVLFNLLLTFGLIRRINTRPGIQPVETLEIGEPAPPFTAETLAGKTVTLAQFTGKRLALVFMSPNCGPCREKLPELQALTSKLAGEGIVFALLFREAAEGIRPFAAKHNLTMPIWLVPPPNPLWQDYKVVGTPSYCVIEANHEVALTGFFGSEWKTYVQQWSGQTNARTRR